MECGRMPYTQRLPCVKGAVAKRLRDCAVQIFHSGGISAKRFEGTILAVKFIACEEESAKRFAETTLQ